MNQARDGQGIEARTFFEMLGSWTAMKRYRVIITPFAGENIREAHQWLEIENPVYAEKWLKDIRDKIFELETMSESHAMAPENDAFDRIFPGNFIENWMQYIEFSSESMDFSPKSVVTKF